MQDARASLLSGSPADAAESFRRAQGAFDSARDGLDNPLLRAVSFLPVIGRTPDATAAIVEAGDRAAEAGEILARGVEEIPGGMTALVPTNGTIPIEPLEQLAEPLERASVLLAEGQAAMEEAPRSLVIGPVAAAQAEFAPLVSEAARAAHIAAGLTAELPTFLGADGTKRYFVGAQNPAELRGTGGLIGSFTIMTVREGRIRLGEFRSVNFLEPAEPEELPPPNPDYGDLYGEFESWTFWANINMTPDFPSAAQAIETLYEHSTNEAIDGVVVVDPFALADLMRVGGPVEIPETGVEIRAEDAVAYLTNQAYGDFPESTRKEILGEAAKSVLERFLAGSVGGGELIGSTGDPEKISDKTGGDVVKGTDENAPEPDADASPGDGPDEREGGEKRGGGDGGQSPLELAATARALVETAGDGHVLAHSTDPDVQAAFEDAGIAGSLPTPDGDLLGVIANNRAGNKTDFYVDRRVTYTVQLQEGGDARGFARVDLANDAPESGEPRTVIGPYNEDLEAGQYVAHLRTYCAQGCRITGVSQDGEVANTELREELGHPLSEAVVDLLSGESDRLEYSWDLQGVWDEGGGEASYRLTVLGQPTIRPTPLRIEVIAPPGATFADVPDGAQVEGDRAVWEGEAGPRTTLEFRFDTSLLGRIVRFFQEPVL